MVQASGADDFHEVLTAPSVDAKKPRRRRARKKIGICRKLP
jgi:hypothetical protein